MYAGCGDNPELAAVAECQHGVLLRVQLADLGTSRSQVRSHIAARRWTPFARSVVLLQNTPPTRDQLMWVAVLDAEGPSALASHTALERHGFKPFASEARLIHLLVARGSKCVHLPGVKVHESRRFSPDDISVVRQLPCAGRARSAIDAAAWQDWPRFAMTMMAAVVQQRQCTVDQLDQALARVGRVRHKAYIRLALRDIGGGAEALGEIDLAALCRRFQLRAPDRQVVRLDRSGRRRYLDCEWDLGDGTIVVLEIDGAHHLLVEHWEADMKRERQVVISRRWVLRASAAEVRLDGASVVADLRAMGVPTVPRLVRS